MQGSYANRKTCEEFIDMRGMAANRVLLRTLRSMRQRDALEHLFDHPVAAFAHERKCRRAARASAGVQFAAQQCSRAMQAHLYVLLGEIQSVGGFGRA